MIKEIKKMKGKRELKRGDMVRSCDLKNQDFLNRKVVCNLSSSIL